MLLICVYEDIPTALICSPIRREKKRKASEAMTTRETNPGLTNPSIHLLCRGGCLLAVIASWLCHPAFDLLRRWGLVRRCYNLYVAYMRL